MCKQPRFKLACLHIRAHDYCYSHLINETLSAISIGTCQSWNRFKIALYIHTHTHTLVHMLCVVCCGGNKQANYCCQSKTSSENTKKLRKENYIIFFVDIVLLLELFFHYATHFFETMKMREKRYEISAINIAINYTSILDLSCVYFVLHFIGGFSSKIVHWAVGIWL